MRSRPLPTTRDARGSGEAPRSDAALKRGFWCCHDGTGERARLREPHPNANLRRTLRRHCARGAAANVRTRSCTRHIVCPLHVSRAPAQRPANAGVTIVHVRHSSPGRNALGRLGQGAGAGRGSIGTRAPADRVRAGRCGLQDAACRACSLADRTDDKHARAERCRADCRNAAADWRCAPPCGRCGTAAATRTPALALACADASRGGVGWVARTGCARGD